MELEGKLWKNQEHWLIEVPSLDLMTQGETKDEALIMMHSLILEFVDFYFKPKTSKKFEVLINNYENNIIGVTSNNKNLLLSLSLRRQREKSNSTVREASKRLGAKSHTSYARYETGLAKISLDLYENLLKAANPAYHCLLRVI